MNPVRKRRALPALLAGGALALAGCGGSSGGASPGTTSTSPGHPSTPVTTSFDSCLVGRWVESQETDTVTYNGLPVTLTGDGGKVLTFTANGTETANYAHAAPLEGPYGNGIYEVRGQRYRRVPRRHASRDFDLRLLRLFGLQAIVSVDDRAFSSGSSALRRP